MSAALGLGARADATAEAVLACVRAACLQLDEQPTSLNAHERLRDHPALIAAAARLGLPLHWRDAEALAAVAPRVVTQSARVLKLYGVGSLAEAAALVGAGEGAEIVVARLAGDGVTCAAARAPK